MMFQGAWFGFGFFYAVMALALWRMADKTATVPNWYALVPVLNVILFLRIARKPDWWIALLFVPIVNAIAVVVAAMEICGRFRVNKWYGVLTLIAPANAVLYLYLAFRAEPHDSSGETFMPPPNA